MQVWQVGDKQAKLDQYQKSSGSTRREQQPVFSERYSGEEEKGVRESKEKKEKREKEGNKREIRNESQALSISASIKKTGFSPFSSFRTAVLIPATFVFSFCVGCFFFLLEFGLQSSRAKFFLFVTLAFNDFLASFAFLILARVSFFLFRV